MQNISDRIIFSRDKYQLPDIEMIVEFILDDTYIYTKKSLLIIESVRRIDQIDSAHEVKRYIRPQLLIIQGILSYFSGYPFTVYEHFSGTSEMVKNKDNVLKVLKCNKLIIEGNDYSKDLDTLLEKLGSLEYKSLTITLLDRWRKAIYMEKESEVNTYHDESILTHFHILELLVGYYYKNYKEESSKQIEDFVKNFALNTMNLRGNNLVETVNSKTKILNELLISEEASIATKINYFLKQYNMLDDQTYSLVNKLVKIRNAIAHGRIIYREKLIWPLPPFFNLTKDSHPIVHILSIFTARAIALHLGLFAWKNEWEIAHHELSPSDEFLVSFIKNAEEYTKLSSSELIMGSYNGITVPAIVEFFIENPKKCSFSDLEIVLAKVIKEIKITEENSSELFLASLILGDSPDGELSAISRRNVEIVYENEWLEYPDIKDILRYFNFCGLKIKWFETWLQVGGQINVNRKK
ncbi:hypothetical protein ACQKFG_18570 [Peribacillus sp. NPDC076916]|uniref:hypothetical protein n=1 Tax=Peribacillus sp. NPDC076916 TaxID=3390608 RepID=UPI003CFF9763